MIIRSATTEEIYPLLAQLARAGSGEDKLLSRLLLDQQMHHFQQLGDLLDFIHHHLWATRITIDDFAQPLRTRRELPMHRRVQQINPESIRKPVLRPECLSCPARTKQKKVVRAGMEKSRYKVDFETQNGGIAAKCQFAINPEREFSPCSTGGTFIPSLPQCVPNIPARPGPEWQRPTFQKPPCPAGSGARPTMRPR